MSTFTCRLRSCCSLSLMSRSCASLQCLVAMRWMSLRFFGCCKNVEFRARNSKAPLRNATSAPRPSTDEYADAKPDSIVAEQKKLSCLMFHFGRVKQGLRLTVIDPVIAVTEFGDAAFPSPQPAAARLFRAFLSFRLFLLMVHSAHSTDDRGMP